MTLYYELYSRSIYDTQKEKDYLTRQNEFLHILDFENFFF